MVVWVLFLLGDLLPGESHRACANTVYDFEHNSELSTFSWPQSSNLAISKKRYKHGKKSLQWTWSAGDVLSLDLSSKNIVDRKVSQGGLKLWIYNEFFRLAECLTIKVTKTSIPRCAKKSALTHTSSFHISLAFTGWRAVWVAYEEFQDCPSVAPRIGKKCYANQITMLKILGPSIQGNSTVYIDLLRWVDKLRFQSRDIVVPLITSQCFDCSTFNDGVTEQDALAVYGRSKFWQQTYRWSIVHAPTPPSLGEQELANKLSDLHLIERRLLNWYADERTSFIKLRLPRGSTYPEGVVTDNFYLRKRWSDLMNNVDDAYGKLHNLNLAKSTDTPAVITGSPLFCRDSEYGESSRDGGERKFGFVMHKILLPLALEYHLKSRPLEVSNAACQWAKTYRQLDKRFKTKDVRAVAGENAKMKKTLIQAYQSHTGSEKPPAECVSADPISYAKIKFAIQQLNIKRKESLLLLFEYIRDQGWTGGSAVGSTDHEMNNNGAGFTHALFLFRKELEDAGQLESHREALKYYSDFSEMYQTVYEYQGTTADRMRTILLYRLMVILMMPEEQVSATPGLRVKAKIRDMNNWKRWFNNVLTVNKGLAGVIKPDFTSFHHHTFYGSAYGPSALHFAALVDYLTEGTSFGSLTAARENLKKALDVLKVVSVKYSTPNSIGGRFPGYSRGSLAKTAPAFAYLAASAPVMKTGSNTELEDLRELKGGETKAFLRLYDVGGEADCGRDKTKDDGDTRVLKDYLCTGRLHSAIYYLNSLGSLQIMQNIKLLANSRRLNGEDSPHGHWVKNFAAMSIHRRDNWVVTMKGFNNFVWDTESSFDENVFGLYQSHGALQISNSEKQLGQYDIKNGWDWVKIPGTTTIGLTISNLKTDEDRRFNPLKLAHGVSFSGRDPYDTNTLNGVFGMDCPQPPYDLPSDSQMKNAEFKFKKSVFFHNDFLVCVGSDITTSGLTGGEKTYTTLFQDKVLPMSPSIPSNGSEVYKCGTGSDRAAGSWAGVSSVVLQDTSGNRYFIPDPGSQGLHFNSRKNQTSLLENGDKAATNGEYCTAWFDHGLNTASAKYKYTVQVNGAVSMTPALSVSDFTILQENSEAHVVKISRDVMKQAGPLFGYVIFGTSAVLSSDANEGLNATNGPVKSVNGPPCLVTAQLVDNKRLAISVSSPDLKLARDPKAASWCPSGSPSRPTKNSDVGEQYEFCSESASAKLTVNIKSSNFSVSNIYVNGEAKLYADMNSNNFIEINGESIEFKTLQNGFTTEVQLSIP